MSTAALILPAAEAGTVQVGNITVNRMGFGALRITGSGAWGQPANIDLAKQVLMRAVELGVNFIDTADSYGPEVSECLIHDTLAPYKGLVIATKGGMTRQGPNRWKVNGDPEHLKQACLDSLHRLGVPKITLYQLHRPDPRVPFAQSVRALIDLQKAGKIEHIGLSNVSLVQLKEALSMTPIASVQNYYNVSHRKENEAIVDFCEERGIAFIPYLPLGGRSSSLTASAVHQVANKYQASLQQIALAWLLARSPIMLPIPGTSSIEHLEDNIAVASLRLSKDDMALLEQASDI